MNTVHAIMGDNLSSKDNLELKEIAQELHDASKIEMMKAAEAYLKENAEANAQDLLQELEHQREIEEANKLRNTTVKRLNQAFNLGTQEILTKSKMDLIQYGQMGVTKVTTKHQAEALNAERNRDNYNVLMSLLFGLPETELHKAGVGVTGAGYIAVIYFKCYWVVLILSFVVAIYKYFFIFKPINDQNRIKNEAYNRGMENQRANIQNETNRNQQALVNVTTEVSNISMEIYIRDLFLPIINKIPDLDADDLKRVNKTAKKSLITRKLAIATDQKNNTVVYIIGACVILTLLTACFYFYVELQKLKHNTSSNSSFTALAPF